MSFLNTIFSKRQLTEAKIIGKEIIPAFIYNTVEAQYVAKSLVFLPIKAMQPEEYKIKLDINNQEKQIKINKEQYEKLVLNSFVDIEYKIGTFKKEIYVKKIIN